MAAPYSDDLRQKAVSAVERGEKKKPCLSHPQY